MRPLLLLLQPMVLMLRMLMIILAGAERPNTRLAAVWLLAGRLSSMVTMIVTCVADFGGWYLQHRHRWGLKMLLLIGACCWQ